MALKQQLTILCDEGRSHPEYWSLKTALDSIDGGEDDSDVLDEDGSFNEMSFGDSLDLDSELHSMSIGGGEPAGEVAARRQDTSPDRRTQPRIGPVQGPRTRDNHCESEADSQ